MNKADYAWTESELAVANLLVDAGCVSVSLESWFRLASGLLAPIYFDCRVLWSYYPRRQVMRDLMYAALPPYGSDLVPEAIVGVATGGIVPAFMLADFMFLPFAYVRPHVKPYGREAVIEGHLPPGCKLLVVEDHVTTGGSLLSALDALNGHDCSVLSIMDYGLPSVYRKVREKASTWIHLTGFPAVVRAMLDRGMMNREGSEVIWDWRDSLEPEGDSNCGVS